jgi:hypothetical protein
MANGSLPWYYDVVFDLENTKFTWDVHTYACTLHTRGTIMSFWATISDSSCWNIYIDIHVHSLRMQLLTDSRYKSLREAIFIQGVNTAEQVELEN